MSATASWSRTAATVVLALSTMGAAGCGNGEVALGPSTAPPTTGAPATTQTTTAPTVTAPTTAAPTTAVPSTTVPSTTVPPTTVPPKADIVIGFAGDTSFTNGLSTRDPLLQVHDVLQAPDLMVLNLETAVADAGVGRPPVAKQFLFRSPPESLDLLVAAGVDVVALANNHTLDYGHEALVQTLAEIDARPELDRVGAGVDQDAAYVPLIRQVGDWTIGLVSLSRVPCDWSASGQNVRPEVAWACPAFIELADAAVAKASEEADITVVMVHGGTEGVLCPSGFMTDLEQHWADLGVDIVVDGHPHVLQGITSIERPGGAPMMVVHSTGNFAFPSAGGIGANTAVFAFTLSESGQGEASISLRVHPLRSPGGVVQPPTQAQHSQILDQINSVSDSWRLDAEGLAYFAAEETAAC